MKELVYTLLCDGTSDRVLDVILLWLLKQFYGDRKLRSQWADLRSLRKPPIGLSARIEKSLELYPCDLLFVHRDAETEPRENRVAEIHKAVKEAGKSVSLPIVCVVPVRMTEAWLLFDETAIRTAASNPNGKRVLQLPKMARVESEPDPKKLLYELLREASELGGKRRKKFKVSDRVHRVAELAEDFSPLRQLSAFRALEAELRQIIQEDGLGR